MHEIDDIDRKIIRLLVDNARRPLADLGRLVGLSTPSVHRRVRALEAAGLIRGYTLRLDPSTLARGLQAAVALELTGGGGLDRVITEVETLPEVEACWSTAGASDLLLRVRAAGPEEMERLLVRLGAIAGVVHTRATILLVTHLERAPAIDVVVRAPAAPPHAGDRAA